MTKPTGKQYGVAGRVVGESSRRNAIKGGAYARDVVSTRAYLRDLTAALAALTLGHSLQSICFPDVRPDTDTANG